ncbi:DUF1349 domain-containing protein [Leptolyngbya ohadii]
MLPDGLHLTTDAQTDFWRRTHYRFIRDNGHLVVRRPSST